MSAPKKPDPDVQRMLQEAKAIGASEEQMAYAALRSAIWGLADLLGRELVANVVRQVADEVSPPRLN